MQQAQHQDVPLAHYVMDQTYSRKQSHHLAVPLSPKGSQDAAAQLDAPAAGLADLQQHLQQRAPRLMPPHSTPALPPHQQQPRAHQAGCTPPSSPQKAATSAACRSSSQPGKQHQGLRASAAGPALHAGMADGQTRAVQVLLQALAMPQR